MMPGSTYLPAASKTSAASRVSVAAPIATRVPSAIARSAWNVAVDVTTVPFLTSRSARPGMQRARLAASNRGNGAGVRRAEDADVGRIRDDGYAGFNPAHGFFDSVHQHCGVLAVGARRVD